ncbi:ribbon-helix-helix domain-containing protein [uncultured Methanobrevibacter sp.]|uniref:ribbon-helix-helix domain-containing protein n=1 Tax=uncultured Methanobrevibacter sp. TaxID=253161 RepID=UPI002615B0C3
MSEKDKINKNNKDIGKTIATKVPINVYEELVSLVDIGAFLSISDFLREAIRDYLKVYKVSRMRDIDYNEAKKEILSYFIKYQNCYLDELALNLDLDFELVNFILMDLVSEGKIVRLITDEEIFEKLFNGEVDYSKLVDEGKLIKFKGKRLIVESKSRDNDYISLNYNFNDRLISKSKGMIVGDASVIVSDFYSYVGN